MADDTDETHTQEKSQPAPEKSSISKIISAIWEQWKKRPFLRGVIATISILKGLEEILPYSIAEQAKIVLAIVYSWSDLLQFIANLIEKIIPFDLPIWVLNWIIFAITFTPAFHTSQRVDPLPDRFPWNNTTGSLIDKVIFYAIFYTFPIIAYLVLSIETLSWSKTLAYIGLILFTITISLTIIRGLMFMPRFRNGLLTGLGVIITIQAIYWLNLPYLADALNSFADSKVP